MTALNPIRTIGRQMTEAVRIKYPELGKAEARARALSLMAQVHIRTPRSSSRLPAPALGRQCSRRVLIAMAVSTDADLIVADEPTSALDVTVQAGILDLLLELQEQTGIALLLITHDLGVARLMSDRIHVMQAGVFVEGGPVVDVVDHPSTRTRRSCSGDPELGPWDDVSAASTADPTPSLVVKEASRG